MSETVSFVDDRLRAVQKDLVTLLGNTQRPTQNSSHGDNNSVSARRERIKYLRSQCTARTMQARMVRYNILASYLLSAMPGSKYEAKFGARALRTALTCYLNLSGNIHDDYGMASVGNNGNNSGCGGQKKQYDEELRTQDEIMAYAALLHSSAVLRSEEAALPPTHAISAGGDVTSSLMEDDGGGWGAMLGTYRKHVATNRGRERRTSTSGDCGSCGVIDEEHPRWKWALELGAAAQDGNYVRYLALLEGGPATTVT